MSVLTFVAASCNVACRSGHTQAPGLGRLRLFCSCAYLADPTLRPCARHVSPALGARPESAILKPYLYLNPQP